MVYCYWQEIQNLAQGIDLAPFVGNGTKIKTPSEIKPPLIAHTYCFVTRQTISFFHETVEVSKHIHEII